MLMAMRFTLKKRKIFQAPAVSDVVDVAEEEKEEAPIVTVAHTIEAIPSPPKSPFRLVAIIAVAHCHHCHHYQLSPFLILLRQSPLHPDLFALSLNHDHHPGLSF